MPGVEIVSPGISRSATIIDADGEAVRTQGAPTFGLSWDADNLIGGAKILVGEAPRGIDQMAIDKATADREDFAVGDQVEVVRRRRPADLHPRRADRLR